MLTKQYTFKIILIGDSYTGKTTIFKKFCDEEIDETQHTQHRPTIGVDFKTKELTVHEKRIKLQLWDTAGQERFRSIISSFYKGNDCIIFCYDITNIGSFNNIIHWLNESDKFNLDKKIVKILIGNKTDSSDRKVGHEEGLKIANENNMEFFEISAINNKELDTIINTIAGLILSNNEETEVKQPTVILSDNNKYTNKYTKKYTNYLPSFCGN